MSRGPRGPDDAPTLDEELTNHADGLVLGALGLVRKRLGLGVEDAFARLREHQAWADVALVHGLSDRRDQRVVQSATVDGMVVLKEYRHDESAFDPPEEDDYRYFEYEIDVDGRSYEVRNYCDDDEASVTRSEAIVRRRDAKRIARFLIQHEGVRRVTRISRMTGTSSRIVAVAQGWSDLDPLILLLLRDGPVRVRDLRSVVKKADGEAPARREVASSLGRLRGAGLVGDEGGALLLSDAGRALVANVVGEHFWGEYTQLDAALRQLPPPED